MLSRVLIWLLVGCGTVQAVEIKPGTVVKPYTLVRLIPSDNERVWVLPWSQNPTPVEVVEAKDGSIVFTGSPGMYAILWLSPTGQGQAFVTITGDAPGPGPTPPGPGPSPGPGPDPQPGPRPDGFAGDVFDQAVKVGDRVTANKIADVCSQVRSAVAAGGMTRDQAAAELVKRLNDLRPPAAWTDFAAWFGEQASTRALTLPQMRAFLADCITGLEAAGK
jgi:hypothetical protein